MPNIRKFKKQTIHPKYPENLIYSESEHLKGKEQRRLTWYPNSQLKSEILFKNDEILLKEWSENGQLIHEQFIENGISSLEKKWDENGKLIKNFELTEEYPYFEMLEIYRRNKSLTD